VYYDIHSRDETIEKKIIRNDRDEDIEAYIGKNTAKARSENIV
jgi:hypothetical protein